MSNIVDVVIPLSVESRVDNLQLRIALRSIHKYAKNLGNIFIYTKADLPWIQNVNIIPFEDSVKNNKDANLFNKVLAAANNPDVRENFMFWSDDQVLTKELDLSVAPVVFNNRRYEWFAKEDPNNKWQNRMKHTLEYIKEKRGVDLPYNYDAHTPMPYKKSKVKEIFPQLDYNTLPGLCINTAYYGMQDVAPVSQIYVKHTFEGGQQPIGIPAQMLTYIGYDDACWMTGLAMFLLGYFYQPCPYEKAI